MRWLRYVFAATWPGLAVVVSADVVAAQRPLNFVVIVADDLGWSDLGCESSGYHDTPSVDRLAREGMRFVRAYAAGAVCSPTRAALLTGRYPARTGVTDWIHHDSEQAEAAAARGAHEEGFAPAPTGHALRTPRNRPWLELDEITIAEVLRARGYATGHVGKWHLGGAGWHPEDQGFDENHGGCRFGQPPSFFDPYADERWPGIATLPPRSTGEHLTVREAAEAVSFVERHRDAQFYLQLWSYAVHSPLQADDELVEKYRARQKTHQAVPAYAALVEHLDRAVGAVLEALDRCGVADHTVVVFTSDNGGAVHFPATSNAPLRAGKGFPYEGGLRVPLIVRWPGVVAPGSTCDVPVSSIDLLPTLAGAVGAALPGDRSIDGLDLGPLLRGARALPRESLVWHFPHYWWGTRVRPYSVLLRGRHKLVRWYDAPAELFDLDADPREQRDLAADEPALVASLDRELGAALAAQGAILPQRDDGPASEHERDAPSDWYEVRWNRRADRPWPSPELWTNPLEDWRAQRGELRVVRDGPDRNVHLLTRELSERRGDFAMRVRLHRDSLHQSPRDGEPDSEPESEHRGSAGFRVGIRGPLGDWRNALIHGRGLDAGATLDGVLFFGERFGELGARVRWPQLADAFARTGVELELAAQPADDDTYRLVLRARDPDTGAEVASLEHTVLAASLAGNIALVHDYHTGPRGGPRPPPARFRFVGWRVRGSKLDAHPERAFGPILWTQYTLSRGVLKLTAQLAPVGEGDPQQVALQLEQDGEWRTVAGADVDPQSRTATFRVTGHDASRAVRYRVVYALPGADGIPDDDVFEGVVRADPDGARPLVVGALSCNTDAAFPNQRIATNVARHDPDLLFFAGDQIYEGVGGYGVPRSPLDTAVLGYLRKWYLFGMAFRDVMRDRPTVVLPDDHDVYQGNIWGNGGNAVTLREHARGGFVMPSEFVDVVMRTQTAHLPDAFDPTPIEQGIDVCYGELVWGRVGFAILEDRKFKAGPQGRLSSGSGRPDHIRDPRVDVRTLDVPDAPLLGERQLAFLRAWAADWRGVDLKAVLSQTIFANVANYHGPDREYLVADLDSNGWPQSGRNRALREMRKAFAVHIAGDQHLPSLVHHGIDAHRDAGWSFCVPGIAVGYPRAWWPDREGRPVVGRAPGGLPNTGEYRDGLGHPITVHAVGNPEETARAGVLERLHDKASGYGVVRFDTRARRITFECWRLLADVSAPKTGDQFPGWPRTIDVLDNYARTPAGHLPTLRVHGAIDPVVQVVEERSGEIVYTLRIRGTTFRPPVFDAGASYRVRVGEGDAVRELAGVRVGEGELDIVLGRGG